MVVTFLPCARLTGVMQERVAWPSIWMVQEPHRPMPQPNGPGIADDVADSPEQGISSVTSS